VPKLYAIVDQNAYAPRALDEVAEELAQAGVEWLQLRAKSLADRDLYLAVERSLRRIEGTGARLWVNDRVDIAACLGVAAVHLGQSDLPPAAAREVLGEAAWIGASTHDSAQARLAAADTAVDLIAIGPVFSTTSKEGAEPAGGLALVRQARSLVAGPLVAIGGIDAANAPEVLAAGADSVAVIAALSRATHLGRAARELLASLRGLGR
jgi:thiamine-phosphate pyrophosphorylase